MNAALVWLIVFILTLVIEGLTVGLVSIWFSIGAIGAFISTYFIDSPVIQFLIFVIVSAIALIITRPIAKKFLTKDSVKTNTDSLIGKIGIVKEDITKDHMGLVKVEHQVWSAIEKDKKTIKKDSEVEVLSIQGVKLVVRKKEN